MYSDSRMRLVWLFQFVVALIVLTSASTHAASPLAHFRPAERRCQYLHAQCGGTRPKVATDFAL